MLINEVEHIVGLSKKSIRYYEEHGLLSPKRNSTNDYRIYTEDDIQKLKIIKFLRELDVPIRELQQLNEHKITLQTCMRERIHKIETQEENYQKVKNMCKEIVESNETFETINIQTYFEHMNTLNKEGFTMRTMQTSKRKKILGAILSSFLFSIFFLFLDITITYFQITEGENMPWVVYGILMIILNIPILGILINLISRIKEIKGGEEDEASKY